MWKSVKGPFSSDLVEKMNKLPSQDECLSPEFLEFVKLQQLHEGFQVGTLFDSSRVIEGEYIKYLEKYEINNSTTRKKKIWAVGPINPGDKTFVTVSENRHRCLQWLDLQPPNSVIYVSFGTTTTFSDEQITELAIGLEKSQQRFMWVVRGADKGDVFADKDKLIELPDGFEERVKGRGFVEQSWAPQMEILGHLATGGFMSHCGWNSSMESISMGVPLATWPTHSDQPRNAFFITEFLKIGLMVLDWAHRDKLVTSVVVEDVIRRLMDSSEGEKMRKRAADLGHTVRGSVEEGGVSRKEIESFISYIKRPM